jgi:hypothetical protein
VPRAATPSGGRRAAGHLRDRLRALGREADAEPTFVRPRWALAQAIATALAVVGSVVSVSRPGLGLAILLLAALSSTLEVAGQLHVLARLTGSRASQDVTSRGAGGGPGSRMLVLTAAYDAARDSLLARLPRPWLTLRVALVAVLACCVARLLGFQGNGLTAVQMLPTLLLLAATPLLIDDELSPAGGEGEAAATVAVLSLAEELDGAVDRLDVWVALIGAETPFRSGLRSWLRRHQHELDPETTVVVAVEALPGRPAQTGVTAFRFAGQSRARPS